MDVLQSLGLNKKKKVDFEQTLFYFFREFHINPFDEGYKAIPVYKEEKFFFFKWKRVVRWDITKKGMPVPLFNSLLEQMNKHYEREAAQMKKARR